MTTYSNPRMYDDNCESTAEELEDRRIRMEERKKRQTFFDATPIGPITAYVKLRSELAGRKAMPKWKFKLADDLYMQMQPKQKLGNILFECFAVQAPFTEAPPAEVYKKPWRHAPEPFVSIEFDIIENDGLVLLKANGYNERRGNDKLKTRLVQIFTEYTVDTIRESTLYSSSCLKCGRTLTDPVSIKRGIGPECAGAK